MITAIVLYDMPKSISRKDCLAHFHKIWKFQHHVDAS